MKKIFLPLIFFLLFVCLVEAAIVSLNVSWQLSVETLRPGGDATISLTFTNAGTSDITSVVATPIAGEYIKITSGKIDLGGVPATTSHQGAISIKVDEDAISTTSYVFLEVDYYTGTSSYEKSFYIPITIRRKPILEIRNVEYSDSVEPGKTVILSFDIFNSGDGPAKDLKIILNKTDLFTTPGSSGEVVIDNLDSSGYNHLEFSITIDPDASIGIDSIPAKFSYYDETKTNVYSETKNIGIRISGTIEFVTTFEPGENFYYGNIGKAEITISNSGSGSAEYVTIKANSDYGSKEFYIGSLDSDDSETIEFIQDLRSVSSKYPITLEISYKDKFQNSYAITKIVEVVPGNAPFNYTIIIVVVVILIVGIWYYRKRKKK
jgi:hypothetical protein